jgi:ABC-type antimicrobial peptide transport system permease subunit
MTILVESFIVTFLGVTIGVILGVGLVFCIKKVINKILK